MNSPSIQTLMTQLQARYPTASLISELLTIHQGSYVIRAAVQIGNTILATGMAAAADIEQAEDRAKIRALSYLGISSVASLVSPQNSGYSLASPPIFHDSVNFAGSEPVSQSSQVDQSFSVAPAIPDRVDPIASPEFPVPSPDVIAEPGTTSGLTPPSMPPLTSEAESSFSSLPPTFEYTPDYDPIHYEPVEEAVEAPIEPTPAPVESLFVETPPAIESISVTESVSSNFEPEEPPAKSSPAPPAEKAPTTSKGKSTKRKADAVETPQPAGEADRSEEIAKIGMEMKRLGWTTEQGRNYLKRTYGKRSRQELDDAELIDFLRYLEFQPSPSESPF